MGGFTPVARWLAFGVLCVLVISSIWAYRQPRVYESTAVLQWLRTGPVIMVDDHKAPRMQTRLTSPIPTLETIDFEAVARRMTPVEAAELLESDGYAEETVTTVMKRDLTITTIHTTLLFKISYRHPNPQVALKLTELFVDEWMTQYTKVRTGEAADYVVELREMRDREMERVVRDREQITEARVAAQKARERVPEEHREATDAYIAKLDEDMGRNEQWRKLADARFEKEASMISEMPLRVLDRPVLAGEDEYVRWPMLKMLR